MKTDLMNDRVACAHSSRPTAAGDVRVGSTRTSLPRNRRPRAVHVALLAIAVGIGVATAPTAIADEAGYLQRLQSRLAYLTAQQLLTEGYKVCQLTHSGHPSSDAIEMVSKDLAISVPAAVEIIVAAGGELGC